MTACPSVERLAAAASGEDAEVLPHVESCLACQAALDDQHLVRALVAQVPPVVLTRSHREALAAEVLARAEQVSTAEALVRADPMPPESPRAEPARHARWRRPAMFVGAGLAAAAALAVLLVARESPTVATTEQAPAPVVALLAAPTPAPAAAPESNRAAGSNSQRDSSAPTGPVAVSRSNTVLDSTPTGGSNGVARLRPATLAGDADYARESARDRDLIQLNRGELTVDTTDARPVQVTTGDTSLSVRRAKVSVIARNGVIAQVSVFAGTAELRVDGKPVVIEAGTVWERPDPRADSLAAFRDGWAALRDGRNADAVAAFDRATDPTVAEDALYWAAIASERQKDVAGALERYRQLLARYPSSTRAADAKAALTRLASD